MAEGFLLDRTYGANIETQWVEGKPEKSWVGSVKRLRKRRKHALKAYLCDRCGRIQLYAADR